MSGSTPLRPPLNALTKSVFTPSHIKVGGYHAHITSMIDAGTMIEDWRQLATRALEPSIFNEPEFVLSGLKHLSQGRMVTLIVVWQNMGERIPAVLRGVFPVMMPRLPFVPSSVKIWRHALSAGGVPLVDRDCPHEVMNAFFNFLRLRGGRHAGAVFPHIAVKGPFSELLHTLSFQQGRALKAFNMHERAVLYPAHGKDPQDSIRPKTLKELSRQKRRLAELGDIKIERIRDPKRIRNAVEEYLALEVSGWKGQNGTAMVQNIGTVSFVRAMTRLLAQKKRCRVDILRVGDKAIAAAIILETANRAWFWKIAYDEAFAKFSPGVQLTLDLTLRHAENAKLNMTDSCAVQDHPMINHLWTDRLMVTDYVIGLAKKGGLAHKTLLMRETLARSTRAFAKKNYHRLMTYQRKPA
jgi:hypothetical protein